LAVWGRLKAMKTAIAEIINQSEQLLKTKRNEEGFQGAKVTQ